MRIYYYKMTTDNGGAPCVHRGLLSLAICKPQIRRMAQKGDLIFGFGGKRLGNRLIYAAYVTDKSEKVGDYYRDASYKSRPDCIYRENPEGRAEWKEGARFHSPEDTQTDVGKSFERGHVLLSKRFRYFGELGTTDYLAAFPKIAEALEGLYRGHRVNHDSSVHNALLRLSRQLFGSQQPKKATPTDCDHLRRCNRGSRIGYSDCQS